MDLEQELKQFLDGWFFSINWAKGQTVSTDVPMDYIPDHNPTHFPEDEEEKPHYSNGLGRVWTEFDDALLLNLRSQGKSFREIGPTFGVTKTTVRDRYEFLRVRAGQDRQQSAVSKYSPETRQRVIDLRDQGRTYYEVGEILGLTHEQAYGIYREHRRRQQRQARAA